MRIILIILIFSFMAFGIENRYIIEAKLIDTIARIITRKNHPRICPDGFNMGDIAMYLAYSIPTVFCNKANVVKLIPLSQLLISRFLLWIIILSLKIPTLWEGFIGRTEDINLFL